MSAYIVAAARTVIAPKGGLHRDTPMHDLASSALRFAWQALRKPNAAPDRVILGNALAAGGNPARVAALATFDDSVPAMTIDTQCCSGMDAVTQAAALVFSGSANTVLAGGVESHSQAPLRSRKTPTGYEPYRQAQFTPWQDRDPDVLEAAQAFAIAHQITRQQQEKYAIECHAKLLQQNRIRDTYTRALTLAICARMPALIPGIDPAPNSYAITAATVAPEADGAAALLVVNRKIAKHFASALEIVSHAQAGCDPVSPAVGGITAAEKLLEGIAPATRRKISAIEIMESFAAQAIQNRCWLTARYGFDSQIMNSQGGLLGIGHPIGASGAVLVGNLLTRLAQEPAGAYGLACIPAAGGLGSAILVKRVAP